MHLEAVKFLHKKSLVIIFNKYLLTLTTILDKKKIFLEIVKKKMIILKKQKINFKST